MLSASGRRLAFGRGQSGGAGGARTELSAADLDRLQLLLADWQLLADLSFSDLVLWLPTWNGSGYVAAAQMRPTTGPTVFADDLLGSFLPKGRRPVVDEAYAQHTVVSSPGTHALVPSEAVPVPGPAGGIIGVVARHNDPSVVRAREPAGGELCRGRFAADEDGLRRDLPVPGGDRGR